MNRNRTTARIIERKGGGKMTTGEIEEIFQELHDLEEEIKIAEKKRDESVLFHESRITKAREICEEETRGQRDEIALLTYQLEEYYKENPPRKGKTLKFSGGTISANKQYPQFLFRGRECNAGNEELLEFVKTTHAEYVKVSESVDWARLKKQLQFDDSGVYFGETGEIIEGINVKEIPDKFIIKTTI